MTTLINKFYYFLFKFIKKHPHREEFIDMVFKLNYDFVTPGDVYAINQYIRKEENKNFVKLFVELYNYNFFILDDDVER
jgi:hypothetical protein